MVLESKGLIYWYLIPMIRFVDDIIILMSTIAETQYDHHDKARVKMKIVIEQSTEEVHNMQLNREWGN